jgi:hypothetical protein
MVHMAEHYTLTEDDVNPKPIYANMQEAFPLIQEEVSLIEHVVPSTEDEDPAEDIMREEEAVEGAPKWDCTTAFVLVRKLKF